MVILDLPLPPSVNRIAARLGNESSVVKKWITAADRHIMATGQRIGWPPGNALDHRIKNSPRPDSPFVLEVIWTEDQAGKWDIDNRLKPLLDYLQRIGVTRNDKLCRKLIVVFGEAPSGTRVLIYPMEAGS